MEFLSDLAYTTAGIMVFLVLGLIVGWYFLWRKSDASLGWGMFGLVLAGAFLCVAMIKAAEYVVWVPFER